MTGGYRRTPILQVGAEFYCDTLHILRTVEELGTSGSLYPKGQEALAKALGWWIEKGSFMNAVCLTIGNTSGLPQELIDERRPVFPGQPGPRSAATQASDVPENVNAHLAWLAESWRMAVSLYSARIPPPPICRLPPDRVCPDKTVALR